MIFLKKNLKNILLTLLVVTVLIPFISSSNLNGTVLNSLGLNTTINITTLVYSTTATVYNNSIYLTEFSRTDNPTEFLTFNITESNVIYTGQDLPYLNSSSDTSKLIKSNINSLNTTFILIVSDCSTVGTITAGSQTFSVSDCTGNSPITLNNLLINGDTTITINYNSAQIDVCNGFFDAGGSFVAFAIIFIIVAIAIFIIFMISGGQDGSDIDLYSIAVIVIIAFVILILGMIIINNIGSC